MADSVIYRIEIVAKDGKSSKKEEKATSESNATKQVTEASGADAFKNGAKKVAGYYAATSLARTAIKTGVGLMDVYTGNDYQQRVIEGVMSLAESAVSVGIAFAVNPLAGVATLAVKAISLGAQAARKNVELYTQQLETGMVRERAGGAFNRSRIAGRY